MKNHFNKLARACLLAAVGGVCWGVGPAMGGAFSPGECIPVSDAQLGEMRGGFDIGHGLSVSFGFVRSVVLNGELVSQTRFELPDIAHISAEQADAVRVALSGAGLVQNGTGNRVADGLQHGLDLGTVVQNTLNDQRIQTLTVINAGANTLGLFKSINTLSTLQDALGRSLGIR